MLLLLLFSSGLALSSSSFFSDVDKDFDAVWKHSSATKASDASLRYIGKWSPLPHPLYPKDLSLTATSPAAHHAISATFDKPLDPKGKPLVVQYEVKLSKGLECGGAYLKLISHSPSFNPESFDDSTPYTIMFGPDRCGATNKVHFIFRHKNPITNEFQEKHLKAPPPAITDKKTNLYTLIINPDQSFVIKINNKPSTNGSLLENFEPPVNPPKEIDDPNDKKPADWVDTAKIPDPAAKKPADWDESAPLEIPDLDATQPDDWLPNEPSSIPDPSANKPDDWDDDEDGEWTAPIIPNPKCESVSGCGEWKRPLKRNPDYKGKWSAPLIDNPAYKGPWAPKKIPNPDYYFDESPADLNLIGAIGFEIWTMQDGIMFDNMYVGQSISDASSLATDKWLPKHTLENEQEVKEQEEMKKQGSVSYVEQARQLVQSVYMDTIVAWNRVVVNGEPVMQVVKELPHVGGLVLTVLGIPLVGLVLGLMSGSKNEDVKKEEEKEEEDDGDEEEEDEKDENDEKEDGEEEEEKPLRQRKTTNKD